MKEFISKWSNWWILNPRRKQLDDAFGKELNELIEREVTLRIHDVTVQSGKCTGCKESTGETKLWCCNHCGKRIEDF